MSLQRLSLDGEKNKVIEGFGVRWLDELQLLQCFETTAVELWLVQYIGPELSLPTDALTIDLLHYLRVSMVR